MGKNVRNRGTEQRGETIGDERKNKKNMIYTVPHYYKQFRCTASECSDTCCAGWTITIDPPTLKYYSDMRGAFGNRLRNSIDWEKASFFQYSQRCAFLNEDNLCDIYLEAGAGSLCRTCRNYPRHVEEFEGRREITLSLSCPAAAGLILGCQETVRFLEKETVTGEIYPEFNMFLFTKLKEVREFLLTVIQDRTLDYRVRMWVVLGICHDIQLRIDKNRLSEIIPYGKRVNRRYREGFSDLISKIPQVEDQASMLSMVKTLFSLDQLGCGWDSYLKDIIKVLHQLEGPEYKKLRTEFRSLPQWQLWSEQLMVYGISTYFCGAVYDGSAFSKGKLAVVMTLLIQELSMAAWLEQGKIIDLLDVVEISHRLSRQIEHADVNLNKMDELFESELCYGFVNLMGVIGD